MRQLVQISDQPLHPGVDQFLRNSAGADSRIHEARDIIERSAVARADECRAHRFATAAHREQHFDQAQQDVFLARYDDIGAARASSVRAEKVVRLVDRVRSARDDEGTMRGIDSVRVSDQIHAFLGMQAHARHHEQIGDPAVELHSRRPKVAIPLLQDDPRLGESCVHHRGADSTDTRGRHPRVGEDEREHSRAVIEGAGDHGRQVVIRRDVPQAFPEPIQLAGLQQLIAARASWELHGGPVRKMGKICLAAGPQSTGWTAAKLRGVVILSRS